MGFKTVKDSDLLPFVEDIKEAAVHSSLQQEKVGIMVHFDGSMSDSGGLSWLKSKKFTLGYNRVYGDSGKIYKMIALFMRAPHAGVCRKNKIIKDPNSAYYGLCALTNEKTPVTTIQFENMLEDAYRIYKFHGWNVEDISWRVRGHNEEAIYSKSSTKNSKLWGKLGRKMDPKGEITEHVLNMDTFRAKLKSKLLG